ncbi:HBS1-like protein isoform X2 [Ornithodoros turicata]|uniref:HBS1-like protein isoform X2 n=1 Tax=Ornithodoros turicata TaxID=34597 RepID=UPI00313A4943
MARHRNVRTMNFDDDYEGYYDVYGRSQEEDACISPSTEAQFLYNRDKLHSMSSFLSPGVLTEENENNEDDDSKEADGVPGAPKTDSHVVFEPGLTPEDEVRLYECLEKMQNVVGDSIPELTLKKAAIEASFNAERALDRVLTETEAPKAQRERPQGRKEYSCIGGSSVSDLSAVDHVADTLDQLSLSASIGGKSGNREGENDGASEFDLPDLSGAIDLEHADVCDGVTLGSTPIGAGVDLDVLLGLADAAEKSPTSVGPDSDRRAAPTASDILPRSSSALGSSPDVLPDLDELGLGDLPEMDLEAVVRVVDSSVPKLDALLGLAEGNEDGATGGHSDGSSAEEKLDALLSLEDDVDDILNCGGRGPGARLLAGGVGSLLNYGGEADKLQHTREKVSSAGYRDSGFDAFLTSLGKETDGAVAAKKPESHFDLSSLLDALNTADAADACATGPVDRQENAAKKSPQRTTLDLGTILGLKNFNDEGKEPASTGGTLKLDSILKGSFGSKCDRRSPESISKLFPIDPSGMECGASLLNKKPSLLGLVLTKFPLDRRKRSGLGVKKWLREMCLSAGTPIVPFGFVTPSPDDAVKDHRKRAFDSAERRALQPLDKIAERKPPAPDAEVLPLNAALRQTFAAKQAHDAEIRPSTKSGAESTLLAPSNELGDDSGSSRSSPSSDENPKSTDGTSELVGDSTVLKTPSKPKPSSKDAQSEYNKERGSAKPLLNLVVIGHVDAGKSTLMGHLLYRLGCVQKKLMHKYEQDSKKLGKASFMYAWVLDETSEERNRGITMDIAQAKFETPGRSIVLLDAPGHKDFIPNMITGAAQADVAILVVDATRGEFETGFEAGGQTREHTLLVRSLGVSQLAVVINKLDNVGWDKNRYEEITTKLRAFLKQAGFRESGFTFVPCSGLTGENLVEPSSEEALHSWYNGPYLVQVIDSFKPPERPVAKPFRLCVSDVFKGTGSGPCVSGRIEAGAVTNGDKVLLMPAAEQGTVKGVMVNEMPTQQAFAGDQVALTLSGVDVMNVTVGSFLCDPAVPIRVTSKFQARIVVFNVEIPITRGFPVVLHYQSMSEQASVHKLISQLHKTTGEVVRNKPRCLTKNSSGVVEIKVSRPICVELYNEFKELGRVTLRSGGSTIAAGVITAIT